ncbi:MAG: acetyltransferase [Kiritimatiellia bacterium]
MMKHLIIIGAGGFGRELFGIARECVGYGTEFDVKGFLDARLDALKGFAGYPPVVGTPEDYVPEAGDVFITALGDIESRRYCAAAVESRGGTFISLVHKTASLGPNAVIGAGAFVAQNVFVSADTVVGRHACVFQGSIIGHDARIGDFAHVYSLCSLGGGVTVDEGAVVYPGSQIVPRRVIGANAVVGIGSVVLFNVAAGETVFGNPAKPVARV